MRALLEPTRSRATCSRSLVTSVDAGAAKPDPAPLLLALAPARPRRSRAGCSTSATSPPTTRPPRPPACPTPTWPAAPSPLAVSTLGRADWPAAGSRRPGAGCAPSDVAAASDAAGSHQARLTKPPGSLGRLEAASTAARRHRPHVAAPGARAGGDRRVRRRPRGARLGGVAVAAGGHRPDGGQLHRRWRGRQRAGPPRRRRGRRRRRRRGHPAARPTAACTAPPGRAGHRRPGPRSGHDPHSRRCSPSTSVSRWPAGRSPAAPGA